MIQDEQKKLEDSERRSREEFSDRAETLYYEIDNTMERAENPDSGKFNFEQDELYFSAPHKSKKSRIQANGGHH